MARVAVELTNFTGGELSPRLDGRTDLTKYTSGCATLENLVVYPHGSAARRPGSTFLAEVADSDNKTGGYSGPEGVVTVALDTPYTIYQHEKIGANYSEVRDSTIGPKFISEKILLYADDFFKIASEYIKRRMNSL